MTYVRTDNPANRFATLAAVGALHVAAFYAVVAGLTVAFVPIDNPPPISATNHPLPPPEPAPTQAERHPRLPLPDPQAGPDRTTASEHPVGPVGEAGAGGAGAGPVDPPLPPKPPTEPLFTPKAARPLGQPGSWIGEADYPRRELRLGLAGAVGFTLAIGSAGQVTGCTVTRSSGHPGLDAATCRLIARRARFDPARDERGLPVAGTYSSTVRWQIPD